MTTMKQRTAHWMLLLMGGSALGVAQYVSPQVQAEVSSAAAVIQQAAESRPRVSRFEGRGKTDAADAFRKAGAFESARYFIMNGNQIVGNIYDYGGIAPGDALIRNFNNMVWHGLGDIYQFGPIVGAAVRVTELANFMIGAPDGNVYVATDNGVAVSNDNGNSWAEIDTGLTNRRVFSVGATSTSTIFAGTAGGGIYRKLSFQTRWTRNNTGLLNYYVRAIAVNAQDHVYLGTYDGVYRSTNSGSTWVAINNELLSRSVNALALSSDGLHLYAATEGAGVFRLDLNGQPPQPAPAPTSATSPTNAAPSSAVPTTVPTATPGSKPGICGSAAILPLGLLGLIWHQVLKKRVVP
jgi:hypothetical protein